jgi:membrane protein
MDLEPAVRALPAHLLRVVKNFNEYGTRQAAALAYYAVFSVFPLTLLLAVGISGLFGPTVAQEQIVEGLILFLPEEEQTIELFQENLALVVQQGGSFGLIALIGLIWSALGLFSNLTNALDRIFQVPARRSMWHQRSLAFLMTLALIALVLTSFITSGVLSLISAFFLSNTNIWIRIGTLFLPLGLNMLIFVLLFRFVPARHVEADAVWPAAILGGAALELAKAAFGWYFNNLGDFSFVYGSVTVAIVLLLWAYLTACIFILSAELCAQLNLWLQAQDEQQRVSLFIDSRPSRLPAEIPPPM